METYRSSRDGQIAQGTYTLQYGTDPDMHLMFAWSNSYNKMMRFKCAVGAQVMICMNGVVSGDMGSYGRKHLGTSTFKNVTEHIESQLKHANECFDNLVKDKEILKTVHLTLEDKGAIVGRLFMKEEVLTLTQVGVIVREMNKPGLSYSKDPNSAWDLYNHVTTALKESHPMHYLDNHKKVHAFFVNNHKQLNLKKEDEPIRPGQYGVTFT
jgi:hypothetical protein